MKRQRRTFTELNYKWSNFMRMENRVQISLENTILHFLR